MLGEQVVGLCDGNLVQSAAVLPAAYATSEPAQMSRMASADDDIGERAKECWQTR
jgi:phage baseplate assembly protein gpV